MVDVKLWVAETFSRKRILLNGEDKRAFRLPVFEIFASSRGTCTRITRGEASLFPCILGRRCSVQQFITRGFHPEENGWLRRWFAKL